MATLTTTISYGEPTGTIVTTLGTPGPQGVPGAAATIDAGTTTTGSAGSSATVVNVGTTSAAIFNFTIPRGDQGTQGTPGAKGDKGDQGEPGVGVIAGGSANQVLSKIDSTNYNTQWSDPILFTGGPITSPITFTDGSGVTGFESGAFYVNRTDGYSAALQLNSLSLSSDTQSIGIAAAGITFADATFQSTAALSFTGGEVANPITMHDGSSDSEMSASVFGVELTSDTTQAASLSYTGLNVQISGSAMNVTATGITFPDSTTQTTAYTGGGGGPFLPLSGGTMTGAIVFDGTSGQYINKGNFDTSRGGNYGISLVCSIGYEFNWQAGWLTTTEQGSTTPRPLYIDSLAGTTLRAWDSATNTGTEVGHTGINVGNTSPYYVNVAPDALKVFESTNELGVTIAHDSIAIQHIDTPNVTGYVTNEYIGFEDLSGTPHSAFVEHDVITVQDATDTTQMRSTGISLSANGAITFGDSTTQTTSATNLGYITQGTADLLYYPISSNPSGFIADATSDGQTYGRNNGAWTVVGGGSAAWGSITGTLSSQTDLQSALDAKYDASNPSSFITQGTADTLYYSINNPSGFIDDAPLFDGQIYGRRAGVWATLDSQGYITQTAADGLYYGISNPSYFVDGAYVSSALTGYATESFVTGQGFINQTTADSLYYPISSNPSGFIADAPADGTSYTRKDSGWTQNITFADSTVQTTAAVAGFVPGSGNLDMAGYDITNANFNSSAGQVTAQNVTMSSGGVLTFADSTTQSTAGYVIGSGDFDVGGNDVLNCNQIYAQRLTADLSVSTGNLTISDVITFGDSTTQSTAGILEAPQNGTHYVRKDGAWVQCTVVSIYDSNTSTSYNCLTV